MSIDKLEGIAEDIRKDFDAQTQVRDTALSNARTLTRHCAHAIRAVHREEFDNADEELAAAGELAQALRGNLENFPGIYHAGYTQDALKEYAEARVVYALIKNVNMPSHLDLKLEGSTYMKGLSEVVGELRRRILDLLRGGHSEEVERLLNAQDDIYDVLVTMDYSDAITYGLRRQTDVARSIIERTRGDITISYRQQRLEETMREMEDRLNGGGEG
jgi:translin